jgi:hypothetical protein
MPLSRDRVNQLVQAHFMPSEIRQINDAHTPDGNPMDVDAILDSQAGMDMIKDRREWWLRATSPVEKGGWGKDARWAIQQIRNLYASKKGRKQFSIWDLIKAEYRPEGVSYTQNQWRNIVKTKRSLGQRMGRKYVSS